MKKLVLPLAITILAAVYSYAQEVTVYRHPLPSEGKAMRGIGFNSQGYLFAVGGDDRQVRLAYRSQDRFNRALHLNERVMDLKWHPIEINLLALATDTSVYIADENTATLYKMPGLRTGANAIGFNHDGSLLAAADDRGVITIWSMRTAGLLRSISIPEQKAIRSFDWHPSKDILLIAGKYLYLADTTGNILHSTAVNEDQQITSVRWHPDGDLFAVSSNSHDDTKGSSISLYDDQAKRINTFQPAGIVYSRLDWDKEGENLAASGKGLHIWSILGKLQYTGKSNERLTGLQWNHKSGELITAGETGGIRIWNAKAQVIRAFKQWRRLPAVRNMHLDPR